MTIDHGNRGERVAGVRYRTQDGAADVLAYDKLPKRIRAILRDAPVRLNATETLEALSEMGQRQVETRILLALKAWREAIERERQALS